MVDSEAKKAARRKAVSDLLRKYGDIPVPEHEHEWYRAGDLIHPRMGWPVPLFLCKGNHWNNKTPCNAVSFEDDDFKHSFENFEKGYYYLQAP